MSGGAGGSGKGLSVLNQIKLEKSRTESSELGRLARRQQVGGWRTPERSSRDINDIHARVFGRRSGAAEDDVAAPAPPPTPPHHVLH